MSSAKRAAKLSLGLDLSLNATGIVLLADNNLIYAGCITQAGKLRDSSRIAYIRDFVTEVIDDEGYPDVIVIEGYAYGAQSRSHAIGELGGVIKLALYEMGLSCVVVPPTTLKKYTTGKGNAQKSLMLKKVYTRWDFDTENDNIADAYALARFGSEYVGRRHTEKFKPFLAKVVDLEGAP